MIPFLLSFLVAGLIVYRFFHLFTSVRAKREAVGNPETPLRHRVYLLAGLLILTGLFFGVTKVSSPSVQSGQPTLRKIELSPPGGSLTVEVATTEAARASGLSRRPSLDKDQGMLFLFDEPSLESFWMIDMRFPLDIVYLREGTVTEVFANVPKPNRGETPATLTPKVPADAVLEVSAGESARRGWVPGVTLFAPERAR